MFILSSCRTCSGIQLDKASLVGGSYINGYGSLRTSCPLATLLHPVGHIRRYDGAICTMYILSSCRTCSGIQLDKASLVGGSYINGYGSLRTSCPLATLLHPVGHIRRYDGAICTMYILSSCRTCSGIQLDKASLV